MLIGNLVTFFRDFQRYVFFVVKIRNLCTKFTFLLVKTKLTTAEKIRINKEKKKERRREQKAECYRKNRYTKKKLPKTKTPSETKSAIKQRCYNKRIKQQKLQENIRKENRRNYMKDYRRRRRADITSTPKSDDKILFSNRMDKARYNKRKEMK